ncbi:hypothetical protein QVG61_00400 [Thiohalobacter sp. IOR34]|uniref:sensor domain-containing diguanylate cyclase n=1 Tax=Thiohalobacter sp. IOR34 TaxID=3057176 RepID=UPI0025B1126A|nr:hypothetical protein [Thiohalobacter sp. IOR34]WJW75586.1 hypothetical protein QVG61_00400 [Thiohalobacter sp. IOR34]
MQNLDCAQLMPLLDACDQALLVYDDEHRLQACNQAGQRLLESHGAPFGPGHPLAAAPDAEGLVSLPALDGSERHFRIHDLELPASDGTPARHGRILQDCTELLQLRRDCARLETELEAQSLKDPITGLLNQRGLMVALEPQVSRSRRYDSPLSLLLLRIREADSEMLRAASQILKDQLRWADLVGSGEPGEFIMALPETRLPEARLLADKLRLRLGGSLPAERLAFGLAEWTRTDNAHTLLRRARAAFDNRDGAAA